MGRATLDSVQVGTEVGVAVPRFPKMLGGGTLPAKRPHAEHCRGQRKMQLMMLRGGRVRERLVPLVLGPQAWRAAVF